MKTNIDYWEKILLEPTPIYQELFEKEKRWIQNSILPNSSVLDVGCGDGRNIKSLLEITRKITGIDSDPQAIADAKKNLNEFPEIKILQANATNLPFPDESFQFIVFLDTLVNLGPNKVRVLTELRRVLRKDGKMLLSAYSEDALDNRLEIYEKIGLPIKKIEDGTVVIDESPSYKSEQFSQEEIESAAKEAGLQIIRSEKVEKIAYLLELGK